MRNWQRSYALFILNTNPYPYRENFLHLSPLTDTLCSFLKIQIMINMNSIVLMLNLFALQMVQGMEGDGTGGKKRPSVKDIERQLERDSIKGFEALKANGFKVPIEEEEAFETFRRKCRNSDVKAWARMTSAQQCAILKGESELRQRPIATTRSTPICPKRMFAFSPMI